jgi:hypothetical protein
MADNAEPLPTTLPLKIFARLAFGISENPAYAAAQRGDFPTIKIGGLLRVPVRVALAKIAAGDPEILKAMSSDFAAKLRQLEADQAA